MEFEQLSDKVKGILNKVDSDVSGVIPWLANLYDPKTGGFYMAMSGKNDPDMEPALEMTAWGVMMLNGYTNAFDNIPEEIRQKFINFYNERQNPVTGFYIDKQGMGNDRNKARAQNASLKAMKSLNAEPMYPHPSQEETDSKVIDIPDYMKSVDDYINWVDSFNWTNESWADGDQVQASQILLKALPKEQQTKYVDALIEWFETHQNPETGLWAENIDFNSISGAFKNGITYDIWGKKLPNVDKIIESTIKCYKMHKPDKPFYVRNPLSLLRQIAGYSEELRKKVQDVVIENIDLMVAEFNLNKCPDGGYSASYQKSNLYFGGVLGSHGLYEGDINATLMILIARLELYKIFEVVPPKFEASDFWDWITGKKEMPCLCVEKLCV